MFDPETGECKINTGGGNPCPCTGCCDFNCCDELDYFMHRAYSESYTDDENYINYADFFAEWYDDFYEWWTNQPDDDDATD